LLKQRIITAVVLASLLLLALFSTSNLYWMLLINIVIIVGLWEWFRLCEITNLSIQIPSYMVFLMLLMVLQLGNMPLSMVISFGCFLWLILIVFTLTNKLNVLHSPKVKLVIGVLLLAVSGTIVIEIRAIEYGALWILCCLGSVFAADIGAYFIGRKFGKIKLAPNISPGKTVEGFLGGLAFSILIFAPILVTNFPLSQATVLVLTLLFTVFVSAAGDLFISKMKRYSGVKDSSQILPGHGGVLDRIDSLLSAAPIFALGLLILGYFRV